MTRTPHTFGKYEILEKIGEGGFGEVYKARDPFLDRIVALKVIKTILLEDSVFVERFQREARAAARLKHPHVVPIHEADQYQTIWYIAMEYLPGGSLADRIRQHGPLELDEAARVLGQVAGALDHAHGHGIIHRDVKSSNILFDEAGQAVVTDFGLARAASEHSGLTTSGAILGTIEYMAPEQLSVKRREEVGPPTDVYSLGIVAYEMLTGQVPFSGSTEEMIGSHFMDEPEPPSSLREGIPDEVEAAVLRALSKRPEERFECAGAFAEAFARAVARPVEADAVNALEEGQDLLEKGRYDEAVACFERVLFLLPDHAEATAGLERARTLRELKERYDEAEAREEEARHLWAEVQGSQEALATEEPPPGTPGQPVPGPRKGLGWVALALAMVLVALFSVAGTALVLRSCQRSLPVSTGVPVPEALATPTASYAPTHMPTHTPTAPVTTAVEHVRTPEALVRTSRLYLWAGPDYSYDRLGSVGQDETLTVLGRNPVTFWLRVRTSTRQIGWIPMELVSTNVGPLEVPLAVAPPTPTPTPSPTCTPYLWIAVEALNYRMGPGIVYPKIGHVKEGDVLSILGRNESAKWLNVCCFQARPGWVFAKHTVPNLPPTVYPLASDIPPSPTAPPAEIILPKPEPREVRQTVKYQAPTLLEPVSGTVTHERRLRVRWEWPGQLKGGEWFDIRMWRLGTEPRSVAVTRDTSYDFRAPPDGFGTYRWQVLVVKLESGPGSQMLEELSDQSAIWTIEWLERGKTSTEQGYLRTRLGTVMDWTWLGGMLLVAGGVVLYGAWPGISKRRR